MRLILVGPPAGGKGTQAEALKEKYGLAHISTGDMLRQAMNDRTELGLQVEASMDAGRLVHDTPADDPGLAEALGGLFGLDLRSVEIDGQRRLVIVGGRT